MTYLFIKVKSCYLCEASWAEKMNCSLFQRFFPFSVRPFSTIFSSTTACHKLSSLIMIISFRQRNAFTFLFVLKLVLPLRLLLPHLHPSLPVYSCFGIWFCFCVDRWYSKEICFLFKQTNDNLSVCVDRDFLKSQFFL